MKEVEKSNLETEELRDLKDEDHGAITALARISFPLTQSRFVVPSEAGGKVVTINGNFAAASLLRIIDLPSGRRTGLIAWLMTHPDYRRRGLAGKLVKASTAQLQAQGCDDIVTDVEGYNSGSANVFFGEDYQRLSLWQQLNRWNPVDIIWLWIRTGFAVDPGHFLWVFRGQSERVRPWIRRLWAVFLNTFLGVLAFSLGGGIFLSGSPSVPTVLSAVAFLVGISTLLAAREIGMRLFSWFYEQPLEYREWSGGWAMSLLIAIGFGRTLPLPGNFYPPGDGWSTRHFQTLLGQGAMASTLLVACLVILGSFISETGANEWLTPFAMALVFVGKPLLVFDTLVAVAPFEGFNGRHLRDYNRLLWLALSAIAVIIFIWA